ncbi:hypothetical protein K504DRAFT_219311 [Pleomassaria siparia CBS 279.74]|uniref:Secreted protein n=1 Tax=Pleomassaria siparia CBS 279.74 TaxID=1314801 RepID=A0A6G1KG28_9PLEO|nr:hypothetical protein K504DRAFT_219311 [Pleomassaria siparia CBS 279.74]
MKFLLHSLLTAIQFSPLETITGPESCRLLFLDSTFCSSNAAKCLLTRPSSATTGMETLKHVELKIPWVALLRYRHTRNRMLALC